MTGMESAFEIAKDILWVGALDHDRRLFDELIPLPDGTSYNAYIVKGNAKTALIDTVDPPMTETLLSRLRSAGVERLDIVVSNHAEQDHSGAIPAVLSAYPEARVAASEKGKAMLIDHLHISGERIDLLRDGDSVDLGGRHLDVISAPWVHWPETILLHLREEKILFPCDLFGSHLASSEILVTDEEKAIESAKRYYAEIMMPFARMIKRHLDRLAGIEIETIASGHGPVWTNPSIILDAYRNWVEGPLRNLVVIPYLSMHGSTKVMVDRLEDALIRRGVAVEPVNLTGADIGRLAMLLVDAATIVAGSPTVLTGLHPNVAWSLGLAAALKPRARFASLLVSYGWGGKAVEGALEILAPLNLDILDPVIVKGLPREEDLLAIDRLADGIFSAHRKAGIMGPEVRE